MELNRSVCIDYPEANVPWFHEEHCRDVIQTVRHQRDGFFTEVHQVLTRVLGGERLFSSKIYSPYYYLMDFSFVLNNKGKAVLQPEQPSVLQPRTPEAITPLPPGYTRHCILLMNPSYFVKRQSISDTGVVTTEPQLKGRLQLKQRHLEVLGYDVINITRHDWQSMSLGTAASKEAYLREKIFSSSS
ncbi:RAP domain [Trinorchestia longiramus]|nr:RAP domain [Trinorchestia longiramus]